ncbi:Aste57867_21441 [Aphanomyces stellatus]|uniref:Aste57867_21441 protein n=1 Tax=Aphanomyces stellatus TaxID=120398 RepID=A0A485LHG9_9STRA|nr:hypothetical protein As57867_021372 [Aphanomyces stellatus]VFT98112.1 Aste57867_21441 [Aphanomyces stellatus]
MLQVEDTVLGRLDHWHATQPDKNLFAFVDDNGRVTESLKYKDVHARSTNMAKWMVTNPSVSSKGLGLARGDKVLLVFPPGLDFIVAFLACLRAGVVAVPVYPPDPRKIRKDIVMFTTVCSNAGAKIALTNSTYNYAKKVLDIKQKITFSEKYPWPDLQWVETEALAATQAPSATSLSPPSLDELAFLQYTSGSTSDPKGVMISHGNLAHNLTSISDALEARDDSVVVSWLPQYHDMGLIGAYLGVLFTGGHGVYMSPFSFIKNPSLWIRLISQYKATHLQAPNFAYALTARKFASSSSSGSPLDLSSIRHMINGAEPIDGEALDAFYRMFAPLGLRDGVVRPTYGLAEHTVYVCDSSPQLLRVHVDKAALEHDNVFRPVGDQGASSTKEMVGCGQPTRGGMRLRIVDPETYEVQPDGKVGEIWIASESTTQGYYNLPDLTTEMFHATIANDESTTEYMRTGDLGVLYQHELFICGRLKDLIIVRGRNHYPQDIEKTVEGFPDVRPGCSAAFSISVGGDEVLAVVAEVRAGQPGEALATAMRQAVSTEHGVRVHMLVLIATHSIPKTTSGKISRRRTKQALLDHQLTEVYRFVSQANANDGDVDGDVAAPSTGGDVAAPSTGGDGAPRDFAVFATIPQDDVLAFLRQEIAQMLDVAPTSIANTTTLHELGMDSMGLTQLQGIITNKYNLHVPEEVLYGESTTLPQLYAALHKATVASPQPNEGGDQQTSFLQEPTTPTQASRGLCCGCIAIR